MVNLITSILNLTDAVISLKVVLVSIKKEVNPERA